MDLEAASVLTQVMALNGTIRDEGLPAGTGGDYPGTEGVVLSSSGLIRGSI